MKKILEYWQRFFASHRITFAFVWFLFSGLAIQTAEQWFQTRHVNWSNVWIGIGAVVLSYMRSPSDTWDRFLAQYQARQAKTQGDTTPTV